MTNADSSVAADDRKYVYDAAWNLNYRTNNTTPNTFTVDGKNQLTNATPTGPQTYDDNGNLITARPVSTINYRYCYDDENQLVRWIFSRDPLACDDGASNNSDKRTDFVYDGKGRLRVRVEYDGDKFQDSWTTNAVVRYVYDGMRVIQERNSSNTPTVGYTRGTDLSGNLEGAGGIGGLLGRANGSSGNLTNHSVYHADGNGNVTYMLNSSQSVVASYRYDPFGNTISSSGTLAAGNVYRYSSKEIHVNSSLYYYGYRFYHPNLQRWPNRDPIGERGGINLYAFVQNAPTLYLDPEGRSIFFPTGDLLQAATERLDKLCKCRSMVLKKEREVSKWVKDTFPGDSRDNEGSVADMMAHCVMACELAKNEAICKSAEYDVRKKFQSREHPDRRGGDKADFENNKIGFQIADKEGDCKEGCLQALKDGTLWTVDPIPPYSAHPVGPPPNPLR